ncbi:MAG: hypothetical protein ACKOWF_19755 [Chloroflexota bacterium]
MGSISPIARAITETIAARDVPSGLGVPGTITALLSVQQQSAAQVIGGAGHPVV